MKRIGKITKSITLTFLNALDTNHKVQWNKRNSHVMSYKAMKCMAFHFAARLFSYGPRMM